MSCSMGNTLPAARRFGKPGLSGGVPGVQFSSGPKDNSLLTQKSQASQRFASAGERFRSDFFATESAEKIVGVPFWPFGLAFAFLSRLLRLLRYMDRRI